jgi:hypothetical protein
MSLAMVECHTKTIIYERCLEKRKTVRKDFATFENAFTPSFSKDVGDMFESGYGVFNIAHQSINFS